MDHISCSQINLYLHCPLKYKFNYIDKLPKPFKPSGLAFGSAIHAALAWLHKQRMNGDKASRKTLLSVFDADWYAQTLDTKLHYRNGETGSKLKVLGKEMLAMYFDQAYQKPVGAEVAFTLPLVDFETGEKLPVDIEGYIDLIEKDDTIVEFKTSSQTMRESDLENHLQLTAYGYAYKMLYQREPRHFRLVDFVKNKKPKVIKLEAEKDRFDYRRFFHLAQQVHRAVKENIFFPRQSFMCKDCEFARACKSWSSN